MWLSHQYKIITRVNQDQAKVQPPDESATFKVTKAGGMKSLFFSGEGFVCRFTGPGRVWLQTRNPMVFLMGAK